jgi:hypothetical protein
MQNIFENRTFDMEVFVNFPKCTKNWQTSSGAGCLLTAAFAAMGLYWDLSFSTMPGVHLTDGNVSTGRDREFWVNHFSEYFGVDMNLITKPYDFGRTIEAVDVLFGALRSKGMISTPAEFEVLGTLCKV